MLLLIGVLFQPGISGVKSREDLVMSNTDLTDPFGAAPFKSGNLANGEKLNNNIF